MSNPSLPPLPPPGFALPTDLTNRFASLVTRMQTRGMAEIAEVLGPEPNYTVMPSGRLRATSRRHVPIAQLTIATTIMGTPGQETLDQEGAREKLDLRIYWAASPLGVASDPVTEANYTDRWLILPQRAPGKEWRITACVRMGPYYYALLDEGATADIAGGVK